MAEDELFNIDVVRDFMSSKGGKVKNHDLVTHFKTFLNDPRCKVSNRQKFKQFVNTLASVKLDETGEKVLVLKKKYRGDDVAAATPKKEQHYKVPAPKAKLKDAFQVRKPSEDESSSAATGESLLDSIQKELVKSKVSDLESAAPAPDYDDTPTDSQCAEPKPDYNETEEEPAPDYDTPSQDDTPMQLEQTESVDDFVDAKEELNDKTEDSAVNDKAETSGEVEDRRENRSENVMAVSSGEDSDRREDRSENVVAVSSGKDGDEKGLDVVDKDVTPEPEAEREQTPPEPSGGDQKTTETAMEEKQEEKTSNSTQENSSASEVGQDVVSPVSVKDRAQHLNKITSQTNLQQPPASKKQHKKLDGDGDSTTSVTIILDPIEREWLTVSSKADYHPMAKLLNSHPNLAKRKDFITGYTGLHWACKHGNIEIVKLLCGAGASVNTRSNGGYTPLHLASMHSHENVVEILVSAYGADSNLRDYSGKKPKQYLKNSASTHIQQLLQSRRSSQSSGFKRTGSYSSKIGTAGHFGIKMRSSWVEAQRRSSSRSPSPSPNRKSSDIDPFMMLGGEHSKDAFLMPPPHDVPIHRKKRSKKQQATDMFTSGGDMNRRSGSDPSLSRPQVIIDKPVHQSASYTSFV